MRLIMFWFPVTVCFVCHFILVNAQNETNVTCDKPNFDRFMVAMEKKEKYVLGDKVELTCRPGYTLQGKVYVQCLQSGMWTTPNAECHRKKCTNYGDILNGQVIVPDSDNAFKFGTNITYKCNTGYLLLGSMVRTCLLTGNSNTVNWQPAAPTCEIEKCKKQPDIENGKYYPVQDFYNYLETITFTCNKDFSLIGNTTTTCMTNGTWSSPVPKCEQITCSAPNIEHGTLLVGSSRVYKHGQSITIGCENGFTLNGHKMCTCEYSSWNPPLPTCVPINKTVPTPSEVPSPGTNKQERPTPENPKSHESETTTETPKTGTHKSETPSKKIPNPETHKPTTPKSGTSEQTTNRPSKAPSQNPPMEPPMSKWKRHVVLVLFASVASLLFVLVTLYCCFLK
ncbi:JM4 [macacine gammaherpesvirus 11]|uniref:JM4 n=2 Tax=macacine gammaherpesvirus 11 TaxID=2560570 RepID=G9JMI2_9GAMA|nr:JM4 [Macaca fuscata rhadinovirus]AAS99981.1 JM4 [Macaca fuscata rhadinovirus]AEW87529.1 JM4 [Macaca fuscata rhadinovirus]AEW87699.1 JM4 [Macaca fuscata rhadinovirus]